MPAAAGVRCRRYHGQFTLRDLSLVLEHHTGTTHHNAILKLALGDLAVGGARLPNWRRERERNVVLIAARPGVAVGAAVLGKLDDGEATRDRHRASSSQRPGVCSAD